MPKTDIEQLQEIMEELPDSNEYAGAERREYSLTKGDILLIYKIARIASTPHICPFEGEESAALHSVARNVNKTQKVASMLIITGIVTTILSGLWLALKHAADEWVRTGAQIK